MRLQTHKEAVNKQREMHKLYQSGLTILEISEETGYSESYIKHLLRSKPDTHLHVFGEVSTRVRNALLGSGIDNLDKLRFFVSQGGDILEIGKKGWNSIYREYGIKHHSINIS